MGVICTITGMVDDPARLEQWLRAGKWLRPGEVAVLLGASRSTVHRMLAEGVIGYRIKPGMGHHRECDPADVTRELTDRRRRHGS